jgi:MATE family multidrug resistance protein
MIKNSLLKTMSTIIKFALPVSASGIMNMIASFIAMMMVAHLGQKPLAAGALAMTTYITIMTITVTIFYAVGILISHHQGQEKTAKEIGIVVKNGIWLALLIALPAMLVLQHADNLLILFGQDPVLVELTHPYFHYAGLGMFPLLFVMVISQFFAGTGRPKLMLLIALISLPLTIFSSYCFVLGKLGMPMLGLAGITFATLVVQSIMMTGLAALILYDRKYQIPSRPYGPNIAICKSILSLGLPIGIQFGGEIAAMSVTTYLLGHFGIIALAASQVVSQYSLLVVMISIGLTQSISILISKAYAQRNISLIKIYLNASLLVLLYCFLVIAAIFCFFSKELLTLYVSQNVLNTQMIYYTHMFFIISAFTLFFDGMRHLLSGALRGLHDSHTPMRIGIITLWLIALPISYSVGFTFHGGPIGLRIGFASGFVIAAIVLWYRVLQKLKIMTKEHIYLG